MSQSVILDTPEPGVRLITISRPEKRNALDRATYGALGAALTDAAQDETVRVAVLTGAGGCFTSGNDLADFQDTATTGEPSAGLTYLKALSGFSKPVVAAVEGFAVGIGTTMLLHCDLAFAGAGARFRLPFVNLGLCPEGASSFLLPRVAGTKRAAELLMLGEPFGAQAAMEAGIVNAATAEGAALETALEKARALALLPPVSLATTKRLMKAHLHEPIAHALELEAERFHALRRGPEAQAAFAAFFRR
ncbi:MAG: enoyl-CoA hydratase-related protein [Pseudomonadota bacterium]